MSRVFPDDLVVEHRDGGVAVVTLNRPERLNAVTMALQQRLDQVLTELEEDPHVQCLVLTGAGERAFSSGYDLREMADWSEDELLLSLLRREAWIWHVATTPLPVVAALNGLAFGAGAIMASAVDIRIGGPATVLRFTAAAYGGANATWSLPALVGPATAAEVLMTAREIDAREAERIGLLNAVVDVEQVLESAVRLARQIAGNPPQATRAIKRLLREHHGRSMEDRFAAENLVMRTELRPRPIRETYADEEDEPPRHLGRS